MTRRKCLLRHGASRTADHEESQEGSLTTQNSRLGESCYILQHRIADRLSTELLFTAMLKFMSSSAEHRLMDIVDEFAERAQAGERPSIEHYCARHPDLGDDLRELLDALNILDELKPISSETASPVDQNLPDQIGDYRIIGEIGRGGMGVVYEAEQESLGRRVAVKVLPRHQLDSDAAQIRFQREAKAAARMHHSNIVPVFEVGREGDYFFYAMQLIAGQGLDQVIDELGFGQSIVHSLTEQLQTEPPTLEAESQNSHSNAAQSGGLETGRNVKTSSVFSSRDQFYTSATKIALQAADALAYAHERGVTVTSSLPTCCSICRESPG